MDERILESQKVVVVILVKLSVELQKAKLASGPRKTSAGSRPTYQIEDRHLHHTLVEVGRSVLDHLHGNHFLRLQILTFDDLPKGALPENIQDQVAVSTVSGQLNLVHQSLPAWEWHTCDQLPQTLICR